jgi:Ser/Thr protein kinase RdoA (MazF antagonist)
MTAPARQARLVLVDREGRGRGVLAPFAVDSPWWNDIAPVVRAARAAHGVEVVVLRLLASERAEPHGGLVTYLAECGHDVGAAVAVEMLDEHPLRQPYARPGGPAADLAWADAALARHGRVRTSAEQIRTWNLSSLWRLSTGEGAVWLKVVPGFFAHEGRILGALAGGPVPRVLAHEGGRLLLAELPGDDNHETVETGALVAMVELAVGLQRAWLGRSDELLALGLPDFRLGALAPAVDDVLERAADELAAEEVALLRGFVGGLPARAGELAACGLPDTLVHGDLHPGNFRGAGAELALLDWGDAGVGHPLLDQSAFLDRVPGSAVQSVRAAWFAAWRGAVSGSDPERASSLLAPVAAARQAVIYRCFLDAIEPSEHAYHRGDPARWLRKTAALLRAAG